MIVLIKYSNNSNIFLVKNVIELLKHTKINNHAIILKKGIKSLIDLIYNLGLIELKILKTYIKINLINDFI